MNQLKTTKLTAAKLCHEIAGHLSIMKFLQEDIKTAYDGEDLKMLFDGIDLLNFTMEFFRRMYSSSSQKTGICEVVSNIYKLKNISISDLSDIFEKFKSSNEENILACLLYVVLKSSRSRDSVVVTNTGDKITIESSTLSLPSSVMTAINDDNCEEDIFNVFIKYAKSLARFENVCMNAEALDKGGLQIKLWKK